MRPAGSHGPGSRQGAPPPGTAAPNPASRNLLNVPALAGNNLYLGNFLNSNNNVPGLGFDYPHLAAINPGPARFRQAPYIGYGGAFYSAPLGFYDSEPAPADDAVAPTASQPQAIVEPEETQEPAPEDDNPSAPLPDVGNFILITKDGTQITAGAFYHQGLDVIYITPSGARRSVPFSDLDMDATVLINQERGTDLQNLM
jgi:hypothetical protein